jgi:hypothetical protein
VLSGHDGSTGYPSIAAEVRVSWRMDACQVFVDLWGGYPQDEEYPQQYPKFRIAACVAFMRSSRKYPQNPQNPHLLFFAVDFFLYLSRAHIRKH